jgi:hypothetical protein
MHTLFILIKNMEREWLLYSKDTMFYKYYNFDSADIERKTKKTGQSDDKKNAYFHYCHHTCEMLKHVNRF